MTAHLLTAGTTLLNRYRIKAYIAEGGMQQVFEALDLSFQRPVAVKVPKDKSAEKRFNRSAQVSARITHQNIAKTLDFFEETGSSYLVEELIVGKDLDFYLKKVFPYFDPHLAAHFIHQFAKGLAAAHHADVFHRDLKPSNVMVSGDMNLSIVKITDFGIAKMAAAVMESAVEGGETTITGSQTAMGTLPYMAPEMIESPKDAGKPADVWALGAILFRLLSGVVPFGSGLRAIPTILEARIPERPALLKHKVQFSELASGLWRIIEACLQKDPALRPTADSIVVMCNELCYSEAVRMSATISSYGQNKGRFGFLLGEDARSYFFHEDSYFGEKPVEGAKVAFCAYEGTPHPRAFPVLPLKTSAAT